MFYLFFYSPETATMRTEPLPESCQCGGLYVCAGELDIQI